MSENFIFNINKSNTKSQLFRFLKIYDGFQKAPDEAEYINYVIESTLNEGIIEYKELKSQQNQQFQVLEKAEKITSEGPLYGLFALINQKRIVFYSLINSVHGKVWEFNVEDVKVFLKYRYLFRHTAIEIWFYNKKRSFLLNFQEEKTRDQIYALLKKHCKKNQNDGINVKEVQNQWVNGQLSNFEYLMFLNTMANRSFNDLSAYPIFPWVIDDYHTEEFNLNNPEFFRDLSKPVGALNKHRLQKLRVFYQDQLKDKNLDHEPYIFPTHYSSPGLVVYFLIRKIPEFVIKLQNGVFGPTDRIFRSIDSTWYAALNLEADFKELIPEFYIQDGDFLVNNEKLELGVTNEGENIDDVNLPPWASSIHDLMGKMKAALESSYVSSNINQWIDLIFGYKQNGVEAINNNNLFYPYTYEQNVKWDQYKSQYQKQAMKIQIMEFGQVPLQLFQSSHPQRNIRILNMNNIGLDNINQVDAISNYIGVCNENRTLKDSILKIQNDFNQKLQQLQIDTEAQLNQKEKEITKIKENYHKSIQDLTSLNKEDYDSNNELDIQKAQDVIARKNKQINQLQEQIGEIQQQNAQLNFIQDGLKSELEKLQHQIHQDPSQSHQDLFNPLNQDTQVIQPMDSKDFDFLNETDNE